jgi:hypothetical protein
MAVLITERLQQQLPTPMLLNNNAFHKALAGGFQAQCVSVAGSTLQTALYVTITEGMQ